LSVLLLAPAEAQPNDADRFVDAAKALELFTTDEEHGIPADILQRARGIAVIP
jgi:lipid-binding SYLF domain-containing protein